MRGCGVAKLRRLFCAVLLSCTVWSVAWAQATTATLTGRVIDSSGAVVPGTKVTLVNNATNESHSMQVGANGEFTFLQLPPGAYTLTSEQQGFRRDVHAG